MREEERKGKVEDSRVKNDAGASFLAWATVQMVVVMTILKKKKCSTR